MSSFEVGFHFRVPRFHSILFLGFILFYSSSTDHMNRENLLKPWNISFSLKLEFLDEFPFNLCNKNADFLIKKMLLLCYIYVGLMGKRT